MKNKTYILNTCLTAVVFLALLAIVLMKTFFPAFVIPRATIPNIALLSILALLIDSYIAPDAKRCYICIPLFSAFTFGILPFAAGYSPAAQAIRLAVIGGVSFTLLTWLFSSIRERIASGPKAKAAPLIGAVGLYLAVQCFAGMI